MQCPQCHYENDQAVKFCEECGTRLIQSCPSCGHEVRPTAKFCPECGMSLAGKQKAKGKEQKGKRRRGEEAKGRKRSQPHPTPYTLAFSPPLATRPRIWLNKFAPCRPPWGRQRELEHLQKALEQARAGHGQIVGVMGEPGVGKSRLFHEFKLVSQKGCLVLETFSVSHGKAYAYLPLIELLKHYFQITLHDDERKMREKIAGKVLVLDRSLEETLPYLFFLLGIAEPTSSLHQMDPQIRRKRTFEAIKRLLVRESLNQPLGQAEAEELLTVLLGEQGGATHASPLRQFILAKTEGNPFFMEEIVQDLFEQKVLVRDVSRVGTAHPTPTGALPESFTDLHLPPTVQGVLTARIDRLPLEEKALLQTLTVMGKEFPFSLLKHVVNQSEDKLQPLLFHLQEAEFIYEQEAEKVGWAVPTKKSVLPRQGRWAVPTLPWRPKQRIIFSV